MSLMFDLERVKICILGLGYVGLPLAVEFGKRYNTIGFDINQRRISELRSGVDHTLEVEPELLAEARKLSFTDQVEEIRSCNVYIVTVPTPIDEFKTPDLRPLQAASRTVGRDRKSTRLNSSHVRISYAVF